MRYVADVNESCIIPREEDGGIEMCHSIHEYVLSHSNESRHTCDVIICINEACHHYESVWMSHVPYAANKKKELKLPWHIGTSHVTYEWVMSHTRMCRVTHMHNLCRTCDCNMSHMWMRCFTRLNELCHRCESCLIRRKKLPHVYIWRDSFIGDMTRPYMPW